MHQAKYTNDLMKKFNKVELKPVSTPMSSTTSLGPNEDGEAVDQITGMVAKAKLEEVIKKLV